MSAAEAAPPPHLGAYIPNSQLLSWCKHKQVGDWENCSSFIDGVIQATGMQDTKWPKGPIALPIPKTGRDVVPIVVQYLEKLGSEDMSRPAVRSVYEAVVSAYPYKSDAAPMPSN
ncbi:Rap1a/Tai family immunity protein [Sphingomonas piscis]|uniref:Rap1a/Tai family immunity protein n=1 Tax=Sphingomonas piscis TaxID=2714943 RepID=UPI003CCD2AF8